MKQNSKILVVRPDAIGDVTLMIPLLNSLKKTLPHCHITVLLQNYTKELLHNHPSVDELIFDWKKQGKCKNVIDFFRYARYLRSFNFDIVIFSYIDACFSALSYVARIPIRIGDGQKLVARLFLNRPVPLYFRDLRLHEIEQNINLLKGLNIPIKPSLTMDLFVPDDSKKEIRLLLSELGWKNERLICIHPATGGGNRAWLPKKYAELIKLIHQHGAHRVVLTGFGQKEKETIDAIISGCDCEQKPYSLFEKTSLDQLKALLLLSEVVIGTDTGPTHMAAALKRPVLCISPTKYVKSLRWGPWQTPNIIVGKPEECDLICDPHRCTEPFCLDAIDVQKTFLAIQQLLKLDYDPIRNKLHWFNTSTTTAYYLRHDNDLRSAKPFIKQALLESLRVVIISPKKNIIDFYKENKQIRYFKVSRFNIIKLFSVLSHHDITIIHLFYKNTRWFWTKIIRQFVALSLYCPPIIVSTPPKGPCPEHLTQFYWDSWT